MTTIEIMGAPYVFSRKKLKKPAHVEVVRLIQRPVVCHNGCGLYYIPTEAQLEAVPHRRAASICPDCHAEPRLGTISEDEEIEVTVHMQFGNVTDIDFLRSLGKKISRRQMNMPVALATVDNLDTTPPHHYG